jgi:hypothetical protein
MAERGMYPGQSVCDGQTNDMLWEHDPTHSLLPLVQCLNMCTLGGFPWPPNFPTRRCYQSMIQALSGCHIC